MTVPITLDENEPLGARPNDALVVVDVQEGSPASGQLKVGDTIRGVNGRPVKNLRNFYQNMRVAHPIARIEIKRPLTKEETPVEVNDNLPYEIRNSFARRPGYHYELVQIYRTRGVKFGLAIKTRDNQVVVSDVLANSMCDKVLKVGDHIVFVDGNRVTQAEVAQTLLAIALKKNQSTVLVIGRPTTPEAMESALKTLKSEDIHDPPSVRLNVDVQHIMRQQVVKMAKQKSEQPPKGITINGPTPPQNPSRRVSFTGNNEVVNIMSDNTGRPLRPVVTGIPTNSPIRQGQQQQ